MTRPSVSVIVLNWNGREYLSDCLVSLRAQTYDGPWQVVVVDNGSSDGSADFVKREFPDVRLIESPDNLGFSGGNNLGARQVDSELIAFLNNDTRVDPGWLEGLVASVTEAPEIACAGGKILNWDGSRVDFTGGGATLTGFGLQFGYGQLAAGDEPARDMLFACGGSMIVKRAPYFTVGGLDDDYFLFYEDVDLGWRLWLAGYRVRYAPRSVAYHRHHGATRRWEDERLAVLYERNALYTIYKNYDDEHLAAVLPAALLLTAERATVLAGIDRSRFRMSSQRAAVSPAAPVVPSVTPRSGDWGKLRQSVRDHGWPSTARRLVGVARRRLHPGIRGVRGRLGQRIAGGRTSMSVPPEAVSRLVALDEFGANLAALQRKREAVQQLRRRKDQEIIKLFKTPLEPGFDGPGFAEYHRRLLAALKMDRWVSENLE